jgi:hypothetical protein
MVRSMTRWFGKGLLAAALLAVPTAAFARDGDNHDRRDFHDRDDRRDNRDHDDRHDDRDHRGFHFGIDIPGPEIVVPAPAYDNDRVWVEPVYETVTERVWVPDVTQTQIQHVETPAQYGWRDVTFYDRFGCCFTRHEQVLISPARCEDVPVQVAVCPGHFEMQTHQRLVCDGHWQESPRPHVRLEIPLPF